MSQAVRRRRVAAACALAVLVLAPGALAQVQPYGTNDFGGFRNVLPPGTNGLGNATAEDRLFFIDALRHAGRGDLASFAGGANVAMDESVWADEPYTSQDLTNQIQFGRTHSPYGPQIYADATNYIGGINAYIAH